VGPDRGKHIRNILIVIALALIVWLVPGGARAGNTISNILSIIFLGGLLFLGYRLYMENRETIFGLEERQRGILYGGIALIAITLVATTRMWQDGGGIGAVVWLALIGAGGYAVFGVWRAYREY
jgi:TRAP-type C4-dicarboxylate transport system permease small subunit